MLKSSWLTKLTISTKLHTSIINELRIYGVWWYPHSVFKLSRLFSIFVRSKHTHVYGIVPLTKTQFIFVDVAHTSGKIFEWPMSHAVNLWSVWHNDISHFGTQPITFLYHIFISRVAPENIAKYFYSLSYYIFLPENFVTNVNNISRIFYLKSEYKKFLSKIV